jgi:pimeloyl-ACP methyl ester carboxylesterase
MARRAPSHNGFDGWTKGLPLRHEARDDMPEGMTARIPSSQLPDAIRSPLAPYGGEKPLAPDWFAEVLAIAPREEFHAVEGKRIEVLRWGRPSEKPALLLLHGSGASADWWRFIAPYLAEDREVVALSWPGMGRSDWWGHYCVDDYVTIAERIARETGLFDGKAPPTVIGHSFGGLMVALSAGETEAPWGAAVIIDSNLIGFRPRPEWSTLADPEIAAKQDWPKPNHSATQQAALSRFRLLPPQVSVNDYITDFIARSSLVETGEGWTWRTDPKLRYIGLAEGRIDAAFVKIRCPLTLIRGERSDLVTAERFSAMQRVAPAGTRLFAIPGSYHHVPLDQPLALVSALRAFV